ncbi:MAG: hypothetical protein D6782_12480 [Alphaproteobacteria bacterium]|nr:MAG: hypothetical protein D6782_12480 [Alphaproteobacteria bacterium]
MKTKLNALQSRTLALLQELARDPDLAEADPATGDVRLTALPHAHGDHVHIGARVVSSRHASGLDNANVWAALARKGLVGAGYPFELVITAAGLAFDTGLRGGLTAPTDH